MQYMYCTVRICYLVRKFYFASGCIHLLITDMVNGRPTNTPVQETSCWMLYASITIKCNMK